MRKPIFRIQARILEVLGVLRKIYTSFSWYCIKVLMGDDMQNIMTSQCVVFFIEIDILSLVRKLIFRIQGNLGNTRPFWYKIHDNMNSPTSFFLSNSCNMTSDMVLIEVSSILFHSCKEQCAQWAKLFTWGGDVNSSDKKCKFYLSPIFMSLYLTSSAS